MFARVEILEEPGVRLLRIHVKKSLRLAGQLWVSTLAILFAAIPLLIGCDAGLDGFFLLYSARADAQLEEAAVLIGGGLLLVLIGLLLLVFFRLLAWKPLMWEPFGVEELLVYSERWVIQRRVRSSVVVRDELPVDHIQRIYVDPRYVYAPYSANSPTVSTTYNSWVPRTWLAVDSSTDQVIRFGLDLAPAQVVEVERLLESWRRPPGGGPGRELSHG